MKFGLTGPQYELLEELLVKPLNKMGAKVWIFGSRARGDQKKFSDIDILFESSHEISLGQLSQLREALEESDLPYKVDIVNVHDLADSYRNNVLKDRVELLIVF